MYAMCIDFTLLWSRSKTGIYLDSTNSISMDHSHHHGHGQMEEMTMDQRCSMYMLWNTNIVNTCIVLVIQTYQGGGVN
jgi:hypothetical protein